MKLRTKLRLSYLLWFTAGPALLLLVLYVSTWFLVAVVTLFLSVAVYTMSLKCPGCGKSALYNPIRFMGIEIPWVTAWIPKRCSRCRRNLD